MLVHANVAFFNNEFVASLSDGRHLGQPCLQKMADALYRAGIAANSIQYEWRSGQRMITAGQQVALRAAIRDQERQVVTLDSAA